MENKIQIHKDVIHHTFNELELDNLIRTESFPGKFGGLLTRNTWQFEFQISEILDTN